MSEQQKEPININFPELANLSANILHAAFIKAPRDKAKQLFKEVKSGKSASMGTISINEELKVPLKLALDYSEFRGPGFNFDIFEAAVKLTLARIGDCLKNKKDLNIMTSESGSVVMHLPAILQLKGQYNVMVLSMDMGTPGEITLKPLFLDPDQFEALQAQQEEKPES